MKYITGQEVFNKYGLDYQQLAKAVLNRKIRCYNEEHEEVVDVKNLKEINEPCYPLINQYITLNFDGLYRFLEINTNKFLSITDGWINKNNVFIPVVKFNLFDNKKELSYLEEENSSAIIENGNYLYIKYKWLYLTQNAQGLIL